VRRSPKSEWLFVIGEWLFVIDSGGFGLSSPHLFKPHSPQSDPKKSQITNNKSQMTNSFRIYAQPDTRKNYSIYQAWVPEKNHRAVGSSFIDTLQPPRYIYSIVD